MKLLKNPTQIFTIILLLLLGGFGVFMYSQYSNVKRELALYKENPQEAEAKQIIGKIGTLIALPENEIPQLETIKNVESLKTDNFYRNAQNNDKVLSYKDRKILYRPSANKVIEVQSIPQMKNVTIDINESSPSETNNMPTLEDLKIEIDPTANLQEESMVEPTQEPIKLALINNTGEYSGLTLKTETFMKKQITDYAFNVAYRLDGTTQSSQTVVVVNKPIPQSLVDEIVNMFNGNIQTTLETENPIDADLVIYIGKDFVLTNKQELGY